MATQRQGLLFVVSAPSGAGKHAILERVLAQENGIEFSVSSTTRPPRDGEVHGTDYFFFSRDEFQKKIEAGEFAEWAEVHGNLYGTLRSELRRRIDSGKDVIVQIDVQGMRNLRKAFPLAVTIFIMPPSLEELERRLRLRGKDSEENIRLRLSNAYGEMAQSGEYYYIVVNDILEEAVADMQAIVHAERLRGRRPMAT